MGRNLVPWQEDGVRIDPTGDYLYIEQDWETGVCPPFFGEETYCIDLMRTYG